jgi:hypothetical protein
MHSKEMSLTLPVKSKTFDVSSCRIDAPVESVVILLNSEFFSGNNENDCWNKAVIASTASDDFFSCFPGKRRMSAER